MHRDLSAGQRRWLLALLPLATVALLLLLHPYRGLVHDARLYTIQALSHLQPELFGNDIFVRSGSQDDYTLFSPLFARMINWFGVERAAAMLTLADILLFLAAAWTLARCLMPAPPALFAVLLLVLLPTDYGPDRIFHFLEEFATPRQLAEALSLFCLAAWFTGRRLLAIALATCAVLVHPIIGLVAITVLPVLEWLLPGWRRWWPLVLAGGALAALALAGQLPVSRWQFDPQWYDIVMHRTYLRLQNWGSEDWARITTVIATLAVAALMLRDRMRQLALATLVTTVILMLLALIGGDLLRIALIVQGQPWRALWLATVLCMLLLPPLFVRNWRSAPLARCALLLLAATWTASHEPLAMVTAPLAVAAAFFSSDALPQRYSRLLLPGAWGTLLLAVCFGVATASLRSREGLSELDTLPPLLDRLLTMNEGAVVPALVLLAAGCLCARFPSRWSAAAVTAALVAVIAALAVPVTRTWAAVRYDDTMRNAYREWRALIPPGSEVLWTSTDSYWGDGATNTWLLLQRPSFVSGTQAPNALFSRPAALEMHARAEALWGLLPFIDPFRAPGDNISQPSGPVRLAQVCRNSPVRYLVTDADVADATPIPAPSAVPALLQTYKLYICP